MVASAANRLSVALGTVTSAENADGVAVGANKGRSTGKGINKAERAEELLQVGCLLDLLAALEGSGVALLRGSATASVEGSGDSESSKGSNGEDAGEHGDC